MTAESAREAARNLADKLFYRYEEEGIDLTRDDLRAFAEAAFELGRASGLHDGWDEGYDAAVEDRRYPDYPMTNPHLNGDGHEH